MTFTSHRGVPVNVFQWIPVFRIHLLSQRPHPGLLPQSENDLWPPAHRNGKVTSMWRMHNGPGAARGGRSWPWQIAVPLCCAQWRGRMLRRESLPYAVRSWGVTAVQNEQAETTLRITMMPALAVLWAGRSLSCTGCHVTINKRQNVNNRAASRIHNNHVFLNPSYRNIVNANGWWGGIVTLQSLRGEKFLRRGGSWWSEVVKALIIALCIEVFFLVHFGESWALCLCRILSHSFVFVEDPTEC